MTHEVITFGCRLNAYESEVIKSALHDIPQEQHIMIFNSCAVTKEAERQLKQSLRKSRKQHPDAKIIVTGCAAQINPSYYAELEEVDMVLGNEEKLHASSYQKILALPAEEKILVNDIMSVKETASHLIEGLEGKTRAFIQVQNGCNHRCTFCIIPYGRGNSRSVPIGEIVQQIKQLVEHGYKEVVLTGVDISDYGLDLPGKPRLGEMVKRVLALVPELPRLRLSSIDVAEIDHNILDLLASEPRFMPYLHLSVQAGDNMILKRMKRRHTREQVIAFCDKVRAFRPDVTFGADIIAGFPTEDEAMFQQSVDLITEAGLQFLHVFPYSEREGTPAAKMPALPHTVRKERARILRAAGQKMEQALYASKVGKVEEVLVEKDNIGRCRDFAGLTLENGGKEGEIIEVVCYEKGKAAINI